MFDKFTNRAKQVIKLAKKEAQRLNHNYLGTEHVLLGLLKLGQGVAVNVLRNLNIDFETVRSEVEKLVGYGPEIQVYGDPALTGKVKKVFEYANEEAANLNHNYVGTEHLLLGLLRQIDGVAAQVLENLNVNLQCLLDTVLVGSPDPGEYLIAQTFENHSINLSIGTEDEDKLVLRANNNDWIPRRFHSTINTDNFCYLDQGLEVNFSLLQEEKIQIQFVIAWVLNKNNAVFTWYAVEQSAIEILNQVGFI